MADQQVSVSRIILHPPEAVFGLLASPEGHVRMDGSGTVKSVVKGPEHLELGSRFKMRMRLGVPYTITSVVKEFDENKLIAWAHFGKHRWRYELEPVEAGTMITETFDYSSALWPRGLELLRYPERHSVGMEATLARIEQLLDSDAG
jgi:uncharacterized protein YndB with AHSA1/START domain